MLVNLQIILLVPHQQVKRKKVRNHLKNKKMIKRHKISNHNKNNKNLSKVQEMVIEYLQVLQQRDSRERKELIYLTLVQGPDHQVELLAKMFSHIHQRLNHNNLNNQNLNLPHKLSPHPKVQHPNKNHKKFKSLKTLINK